MTGHGEPKAATPWWEALEDHVAARDADETLDDPWATMPVDAVELTAGQRAYLAQLADQPAVPKLSRPAGGREPVADAGSGTGTGNSPGDPHGPPGVPSAP